MPLPKKVKIGCHYYKIISLPEKKMKNYYGLCKVNSQEILIRKNMSPSMTKETFLHECIHGICETYGIELTEKEVGGLAIHILNFLIENKIDFKKIF